MIIFRQYGTNMGSNRKSKGAKKRKEEKRKKSDQNLATVP
jgi:hypothetical protein